jgi:hypothetical protein
MDKQTEPVVGMGATMGMFSDSHAYTVSRVAPNGKTFWMRADKATLLNGATSGEPDALKVYPGGFCAHVEGTQRWACEPDPTSPEVKVTLRDLGTRKVWKKSGFPTRSPGYVVNLGVRCPHFDYNF